MSEMAMFHRQALLISSQLLSNTIKCSQLMMASRGLVR